MAELYHVLRSAIHGRRALPALPGGAAGGGDLLRRVWTAHRGMEHAARRRARARRRRRERAPRRRRGHAADGADAEPAARRRHLPRGRVAATRQMEPTPSLLRAAAVAKEQRKAKKEAAAKAANNKEAPKHE